jgi:Putative zinc-finger
MLNCKQATQLMSQGQDRPLTLGERIGLRFHLLICGACSNFNRQLAVMRQAFRRLGGR